MVLKIGEKFEHQWKLHFKTLETPAQPLHSREVHCFVHTGPCILTSQESKYCVNGRRGVARCSRKDHFCRRVGNRLALTRAIEHLPVETRELLWQVYWKRVRRPKESPAKFKSRLARLASQGAPQAIIEQQAPRRPHVKI